MTVEGMDRYVPTQVLDTGCRTIVVVNRDDGMMSPLHIHKGTQPDSILSASDGKEVWYAGDPWPTDKDGALHWFVAHHCFAMTD